MPEPLIVRRVKSPEGSVVTVKALDPGLKTMLFTSIRSARAIFTIFETPNVAVSAGPLGTVIGVQLVGVFQSPVAGLGSHEALPARRGSAPAKAIAKDKVTKQTSARG